MPRPGEGAPPHGTNVSIASATSWPRQCHITTLLLIVRLLGYPIAYSVSARSFKAVLLAPGAWRLLRPQPLQHMQVAASSGSPADILTQRPLQVLRLQPLQHGQMAPSRRLHAHAVSPRQCGLASKNTAHAGPPAPGSAQTRRLPVHVAFHRCAAARGGVVCVHRCCRLIAPTAQPSYHNRHLPTPPTLPHYAHIPASTCDLVLARSIGGCPAQQPWDVWWIGEAGVRLKIAFEGADHLQGHRLCTVAYLLIQCNTPSNGSKGVNQGCLAARGTAHSL